MTKRKKLNKRRRPKMRKSGGDFICVLCKKGFTRRSTVKDPHFSSCVKRLGNPHNLAWDAHESCWTRRGPHELGPSGTLAPGLKRLPQHYDEEEDYGDGEEEEVTEEELDEIESGILNLMDEEDEVPNDLDTPMNEGEFAEQEEDGGVEDLTRILCLEQNNSPHQPPFPSASSIQQEEQPRPHEPRLSGMTMNQLVNVPITACRNYAGIGSLEAYQMWKLWYNMLPDDTPSEIQAPLSAYSQKERQQAVVWMAQDVYTALFDDVSSLEEQLKMVSVWRDITSNLGDAVGVARIHDLLMRALGEEGPLMLGQFEA